MSVEEDIELMVVLFVLLFPMGNGVARVNKYLGLSLSPPVPEAQPHLPLKTGAPGKS